MKHQMIGKSNGGARLKREDAGQQLHLMIKNNFKRCREEKLKYTHNQNFEMSDKGY